MKIRYSFLLKNWLRLSLSITSLVFISLNIKAQTGPAKLWDRTFGGSEFDYFSSMQQTLDGGFILGGYSDSDISGSKSQASKGDHDYWVIKLDASGNKLWDKTLGGNLPDYLNSLQQTSDGDFILGGSSQSGISGDKSQSCQGANDYWVVKLDSNGNKLWEKTFGGNAYDFCHILQQTSDGGYIVGGASDSGISGDKSQASQGLNDYWIVKLDANGNKIWDKTFGGNNQDQLHSLQQTIDGGFILGGVSNSGINGDKSQASKGKEDYWVIKLDAGGNKLWDKTFGGSNSDRLTSLKQTLDGGYIVGGESYSGISGDKSQASKGENDFWILKLDANGNKLWDRSIGGNDFDWLSALQQTMDGGYILGGYSSSGISGDKSQPCKGLYNYWVVKVDGNGNINWDETFGGTQEDQLCSIQQTSNGGYIIGGLSTSGISSDKSQASNGAVDYWIIELAAPCSALTANLSTNCKNGNSTINLSVIGIQSGTGGTPSWTLTYTVNGIRQIVTGTTSTFELAPNATPGAVYTLENIVSGTCSVNLSSSQIVPQVPNSPTIISGNNCGAGSATLSATGAPSGGSYVWYDVETGGTPIYSSPLGTFETPNLITSTTYYVAASNQAGCEGTRSAITAYTSCPPAIIPNIVTPNGDEKNDFFRPENLPEGNWQLQVYNRWGIKVFETKDYQSNWPDTKISDGSYFYYLRNFGTGQQYRGWVDVVN